MIDVHQNETLSESFEGDRSRVIGNRCKKSLKILLSFMVHLAISFMQRVFDLESPVQATT